MGSKVNAGTFAYIVSLAGVFIQIFRLRHPGRPHPKKIYMTDPQAGERRKGKATPVKFSLCIIFLHTGIAMRHPCVS